MPVTARLSRRFYETFGDDIVNELVEWLNQVDLAYRSELRDQNELNFARFDAKLEQRLAELRAELTDLLGGRFNAADNRFAELKTEIQADLGKLDQRITQLSADIDKRIAEAKADTLKWLFLFWATTLGALLLR